MHECPNQRRFMQQRLGTAAISIIFGFDPGAKDAGANTQFMIHALHIHDSLTGRRRSEAGTGTQSSKQYRRDDQSYSHDTSMSDLAG